MNKNTERQRIIEAAHKEASMEVAKHLNRIKDAYLKTIVLARSEYEGQSI